MEINKETVQLLPTTKDKINIILDTVLALTEAINGNGKPGLKKRVDKIEIVTGLITIAATAYFTAIIGKFAWKITERFLP